MAGAFDGSGELALLLGGNCGDTTWYDLAAFGNESLQRLHVFIVDWLCVFAGKGAAFAATEKWTSHILTPSLT